MRVHQQQHVQDLPFLMSVLPDSQVKDAKTINDQFYTSTKVDNIFIYLL